MSITLDGILAGVGDDEIVTLSGESVAILLHSLRYLEDRENWLDYSESPLDEVTDADWDAIEKLVGNAAYEVMSPMANPYPENFEINVLRGRAGIAGTFTMSALANPITGYYVQVSPAANFNEMKFDFFARKGIYTLSILGTTWSPFGRMKPYVDTVYGGAYIDWYSASVTYNVQRDVSIRVETDGPHVLSLVVDGKHASSTGYRFEPYFIWGLRSGELT